MSVVMAEEEELEISEGVKKLLKNLKKKNGKDLTEKELQLAILMDHPCSASMKSGSEIKSEDGKVGVDFVDLKSIVIDMKRGIGKWMAKRVVSPFEFYMELLYDDDAGAGAEDGSEKNYHKWYPKMNEVYNGFVARRELSKVKADEIYEGFCYAFGEDLRVPSKWHRVRVEKIFRTKTDEEAEVFFCDIGGRKRVPLFKLFSIHRNYSQYSTQLIRCYLHNVLPITYEEDPFMWSLEACTYFKEIMLGWEGSKAKVFSGAILGKTLTAVNKYIPDSFNNLGVALFLDTRAGPVCTVNAMMVESGHACAIGVYASCPHHLERTGDFDVTEYLGPIGRLVLPLPEVKKEEPNPTIKRTKKSKKRSSEPKVVDNSSNWILPNEMKNKLAHIKISSSSGPNNIMVQLGKDVPELEKMQSAIGMTVDESKFLTIAQPKVGNYVAFSRAVKDAKGKEPRACWYRGMILSKADSWPELYEVLALDHGSEISLQKEELFELSEQFWNIPSFATRVHLAPLAVIPKNNNCWDDTAKENFIKYLLAWRDTDPVYIVYRGPLNEVIELESMSQEVIYNAAENKWVADPSTKEKRDMVAFNKATSEMKKDPMMRPYFRSIGVEIRYEIPVETSEYWHFGELHDILLSKEDAVTKLKTKGENAIHCNIEGEWDFTVGAS